MKSSDQLQVGAGGESLMVARLFAEFGKLYLLESYQIQKDEQTMNNEQIQDKLGDIIWYAVALFNRRFTECNLNNCVPSASDDITNAICAVGTDSKNQAIHLELINRILKRIQSKHSMKISEVLKSNENKNNRYVEKINRIEDTSYIQVEKLPYNLSIYFTEGPEKVKIFLKTAEGELLQLGDPLSDNSHISDDYRFHDVFHMAFAAYLGWSPVLRCLLKRKRKSDPKIDEIEDGARAAILEEAISAIIFEKYKAKSLFIGQSKSVSFEVLEFIKTSTSGLEVNRVSLDSWENAIWEGISCFQKLVDWRSGIITIQRSAKLLAIPGNLGMDVSQIDCLVNNSKLGLSKSG